MKLFGSEFKKLLSAKGAVAVIAVILLSGVLLCILSADSGADDRTQDEYIAGYRGDIGRVIRLARLNIADLSGGGEGYIVDYQRKVIEKYTAILDGGQTPGYVAGYDGYILSSGRMTLLIAAAVVMGSAVMLFESDSGMIPYLCISKKGRAVYSGKLWLMLIISAVLTAGYSLAGLTVYGVRCGLDGWRAPLVSVRSMEFCPYSVSIGGYILLLYAVSAALTFTFAVASALIGRLTGSYLITFLCGGAACTGLYLSDFDINSFFARYRAVNLFGRAADAVPLCFGGLLAVCTVLCVLFRMAGNRIFAPGERSGRAERRVLAAVGGITERLSESLAKRKKHRRTMRYGLYRYELKKIFISSRLIFLVLLLFGAKIYSGIGGGSADDIYEREYHRLCRELSGELTEAKSEYIRSGLAECRAVVARRDEMKDAVQNGGITPDEYNEYMKEFYAAEVRQSAFLGLTGQADHIEELRAAGKDAAIIYDSGWKALFGARSDAYLYALILLLFAGIYTFEYRSGMSRSLPCLKMGGRALDRTKFLAAVTSTAVLCLIFTAADIAFVARQYPLEDMSASALGVIGITASADIPILLYAMLFESGRLLGYILLASVTCLASKLLRRLYLVIPAVVAATLLPHFAIRSLPQWADLASLLFCRNC